MEREASVAAVTGTFGGCLCFLKGNSSKTHLPVFRTIQLMADMSQLASRSALGPGVNRKYKNMQIIYI